jgi:hypothetical protein
MYGGTKMTRLDEIIKFVCWLGVIYGVVNLMCTNYLRIRRRYMICDDCPLNGTCDASPEEREATIFCGEKLDAIKNKETGE